MRRLHNPDGTRWAWLSDDGRLRYALGRTWGPAAPLGFVMLNPSKANHLDDDPTIRRCVGFAKREGAGGIVVCNVSPLRATDPADLYREAEANADLGLVTGYYSIVADELRPCSRIVLGWGAMAGASIAARMRLQMYAGALCLRLRDEHHALWCLGTSADGSPRHPLYLAAAAPLVEWLGDRPRRAA